MCVSLLLDSQVEHAHDNPLEEISLGELSIQTNGASEEMTPEKPIITKTMDLEMDSQPNPKYDLENGEQVEEKKTKKKGVKKGSTKRENSTCVFDAKLLSLCQTKNYRTRLSLFCTSELEQTEDEEVQGEKDKKEKEKEKKEKKTKKKDKVKGAASDGKDKGAKANDSHTEPGTYILL